MPDATSFDELLKRHEPLSLLQQSAPRRAAHWSSLVRVVLSVTPADVDPDGAVRWSALTLRDLDAPVTREALAAWLATRPPAGALTMLHRLFDPRVPAELPWETLLEVTREVHPEGLVSLVPSPHTDPFDPLRAQHAGLALADALAAAKRRYPDANYASHLRWADEATQARYLDLAAELLGHHEFAELGRHLARCAAVSDATRAAYAKALGATVAKLPKREAGWLLAFTRLVSADDLARVIQGPAKNVAIPERLMGIVAAQGFAHGADALAATLDHKKLGAHAALCLATMGERGVEAVHRQKDKGLKTDAGRARAAALTDTPAAPGSLWDGEWYGFPRFGRGVDEDLLPSATWPATPAFPPTPVEALEAAVREKANAALLPPTGWADLLQIVAVDPHLGDIPAAWELARRLGRLGHGAHRDALVAALDLIPWSACLTTRHPVTDVGVGHALLWAGCDLAVFRHAIARHQSCGAGNWIGSLARHFDRPLKDARPPWADPIAALLWFHNATIHANAWQGAPRRLAALDAPAPRAQLDAADTAMWIHATVEGATRATLRLRGTVVITVDLPSARWSVTGASAAQGSTAPLDPGAPLRLAVETARDGMYLGINGALVHGAFMKLPMTVAPVEVVAEGDGARVTSFTLHEKSTAREAEAVEALLRAPDDAQGYTEVAGQRSPTAARLLAVIARLGDEARAKLAADALATMKSPALAIWTAPRGDAPQIASKLPAAPDTPATELPLTFTARSWDDVVRTFEAMALTGKTRGKKPPTLHRGQTESGRHAFASFNPKAAKEDWGARKAVPSPAVYLGDEAPDFTEVKYFVEQLCDLPGLCQKGRGVTARVSHVVEKGRFVVAALEVILPEDGDDGDFLFWVHAAAWKVTEGWAWALTETPLDDIARLLGLRALPPQVQWTTTAKVTVGNW